LVPWPISVTQKICAKIAKAAKKKFWCISSWRPWRLGDLGAFFSAATAGAIPLTALAM